MVEVLGLFIAAFVIIGFGGGLAYLIWIKTRPKKMTWAAKVYQVGLGVRPPVKDEKGKIISDLELKDIRPYIIDTAEKIERKHGTTIYRLQRLNKAIPAVTNDCVDYWGEKSKEISVLIEGETCTLMRKGYDKRTADLVFQPMPHSRINMLKSEILMRKDRLNKSKDVLQAITPWIVTGILVMGLLAITYFLGNAYVKMSDNFENAAMHQADTQKEIAEAYLNATGKMPSGSSQNVIKKEEPPTIKG